MLSVNYRQRHFCKIIKTKFNMKQINYIFGVKFNLNKIYNFQHFQNDFCNVILLAMEPLGSSTKPQLEIPKYIQIIIICSRHG